MPDNLVNGRCCSRPEAEPNYTICFPDTQIIPDETIQNNPFYDFENEESYWTYIIQIDEPTESPANITDLSHWNIQMCCPLIENEDEDDFTVEISRDGGETFVEHEDIEIRPGGDPPIGGVECILKIDEVEQPTGETWIYRITIHNPEYFDLAAEEGTVEVKHGARPSPGFQIFDKDTCGPDNVLFTPSIDCNRVTPPPPPPPPPEPLKRGF